MVTGSPPPPSMTPILRTKEIFPMWHVFHPYTTMNCVEPRVVLRHPTGFLSRPRIWLLWLLIPEVLKPQKQLRKCGVQESRGVRASCTGSHHDQPIFAHKVSGIAIGRLKDCWVMPHPGQLYIKRTAMLSLLVNTNCFLLISS